MRDGATATATVTASVPRELLGPIIDAYAPKRVILFGSRARGDAKADSDFDLFVVLDDDVSADRFGTATKQAARKLYKRPAHIVPCLDSIFREKQHVIGSLVHEVVRTGIVVYERD